MTVPGWLPAPKCAKMSAVPRLPLTVLALTLACGGERSSGFSTGPGVTSAPASTSTSDASSTTAAESSSGSTSASSSTGVFDTGLPPDFGDHQPLGCRGKIDFLFLISRLGTMRTEQEQLLASLPGFIDTITATFPDFDSHIMVANPDGTWSGWGCETPEVCGKTGTCGPNAPDYVCGPDTWQTVTKCDETLGAGLLFNAGPYATNHPCELFGGHRYITIPGEPDPAAAFDCIARVGTYGPPPPMGEALVAAVSPAINAPDGCNAGFLRPDALLVVTLITDVEDQKSWTTPADWYEALVAAKGDPDSVVMLAILAQMHAQIPPPGCAYDDDDKQRVRDLINMFPYHAEGDTCAPTYVPFFEKAAALVGDACGSFIPQ